nr:DUF6543 domain-containing protein [uncultured Pseudomonas sp.]
MSDLPARIPPVDLQYAVAAQFSTRPTLRQVVGEQLMKLIIAQYPLIATHRPEMTSAEALYLMSPQDDGSWRSEPLVDTVLQALLDVQPLDYADAHGLDYRFSLQPPERFYAIADSDQTAEGDVISPQPLAAAFNELLDHVEEHYQQALINHWNGEGAAIDRGLWVQQVLRASLLLGLRDHEIEPAARAALQELVLCKKEGISVQAVRVRITCDDTVVEQVLPGLLVTAQDESTSVSLWCSPAGNLSSYASLAEFGLALQVQFAEQYRFDSFEWSAFEAAGDAFALLSGLLLDAMLADLAALRWSEIGTVDALVERFEQLSEPSHFFARRADAPVDQRALKLPHGLRVAGADDRTAYLEAMIDLTLQQAVSESRSALEGVDDLHGYAARRLREEMLADHPVDANYFADDLILTADVIVNDQHGLGFPQKVGSKTLSLTQLAIARLDATEGGVVSHIAHRDGQLLMSWMTLDYIRELVDRVDVGGTYPDYVNATLNDPVLRSQHIANFAQQWRITLRFDAARARVTKRIDKTAYEALARLCRGEEGAGEVRIAPLALRRSTTSELVDQVHGMYVVELTSPASWLLYCPIYTNGALRQYPDQQALLAALAAPGPLQDAVLVWLDQQHRPIYDHGGLLEPHLPQWVADPHRPLDKPAPAQLQLSFWEQDIDTRLFESRQQWMIELSNRTALSNSQQRWRVIKAFSWELFNVALPLLSGPVSAVAWLYVAASAFIDDAEKLAGGSSADQVEGVVDLLNNTLMAIIQWHIPRIATRPLPRREPALLLETLPAADGRDPRQLPPPVVSPVLPISLLKASTQRDFSWVGAGGLNALTPKIRDEILELAAPISLEGLSAQTEGRVAGLYLVDGSYYVELNHSVYEVIFDGEQAWVMGRGDKLGPPLRKEEKGWRIETRLLAGADQSRAQQRLRNKIAAPMHAAMAAAERYTAEAEVAGQAYTALNDSINALRSSIAEIDRRLALEAPSDPVELAQHEKVKALFLAKREQLNVESEAQRVQRLTALDTMLDAYLATEQQLVLLLDNPTYVRTVPNTLPQLRNSLTVVRQNLIGYARFMIEEALVVGKFADYARVTHAYAVAKPQERVALYEQYSRLLEQLVEEQPLILKGSGLLDRLLAVSDLSLEIATPAASLTVEQVIASRKTTTVTIRFFQAMCLAELALRRQAGTSVNGHRVFSEALAGQRLRVAAQTHHLSLFLDLSLAERIEVLQSAWDQYLQGILNCERIKKLGNTLVDTERLEAYQQQMIILKQTAGDALVDAMREQAAGQTASARREVYPRRALQVAHTLDGQIVIGSEATVDGRSILQVQGTFNKRIIHSFERVDGMWQEQVAVAQPYPEPSPAVTGENKNRTLAQALLEQNPGIIQRAGQMVVEDGDDQALIAEFDGQIDNLTELREELADADPADDLLARLDDALISLRAARLSSLTELYSKTRYPSANALNFLHERGLIKAEYVGPRQQLLDGYLDEYRISLVKPDGQGRGKALWAAHFHFTDAQAAPTAFGKGHLKQWGQRKLGYREQMAAAARGQVLSIYRGNLTYAQARQAIPFNDLG